MGTWTIPSPRWVVFVVVVVVAGIRWFILTCIYSAILKCIFKGGFLQVSGMLPSLQFFVLQTLPVSACCISQLVLWTQRDHQSLPGIPVSTQTLDWGNRNAQYCFSQWSLSVLPDIQYLKTIVSYILYRFLVLSVGKLNLVPVTPVLRETEVILLLRYSFYPLSFSICTFKKFLLF